MLHKHISTPNNFYVHQIQKLESLHKNTFLAVYSISPEQTDWSTQLSDHSLFLRVVSGSRDTTLRVWDVSTGRCEHVLTGHVAAVRCVQYDGRRVVSGGYDYMVKVWDPETEACLHTLQGHTNRVYSLQVKTHTTMN